MLASCALRLSTPGAILTHLGLGAQLGRLQLGLLGGPWSLMFTGKLAFLLRSRALQGHWDRAERFPRACLGTRDEALISDAGNEEPSVTTAGPYVTLSAHFHGSL